MTRTFPTRVILTLVFATLVALVCVATHTASAAGEVQPVAVIVNRSNVAANLTVQELRRIVKGEQATWPDGKRVTLVLRHPGSPERQSLLRRCCKLGENDYKRLLLLTAFRAEFEFEPRVVASAASVRKFVVNVPGAVGVIPLADVDDSVKVLSIDGRPPNSSDYPIQ